MRMLLVRRARIECFIVFDYRDRYPEATAQLARWVEEGKVAYAEDVVDGLEQAPKVINRLFDGSNAGKLIIRICNSVSRHPSPPTSADRYRLVRLLLDTILPQQSILHLFARTEGRLLLGWRTGEGISNILAGGKPPLSGSNRELACSCG